MAVVLLVAGEARAEDSGRFEDLWRRVAAAAGDGASARDLELRKQAAMVAGKVATTEAPLSVDSTVSRADARPVRAERETQQDHDYVLSNGVSYRNRESVAVTLSLKTNYEVAENQPVATATGLARETRRTKQNALNLKVSYDVLKGGAAGTGRTTERAEAADARRRLHDTESESVQFIQDIHSLTVDYFAAACAVRPLSASAQVAAKAVEEGRSRVEAHILPEKDFLNFIDLEQNIALRISAKRAALASLRAQMTAYGGAVVAALDAVPVERFACDTDPESALAEAQRVRVPRTALRETPAFKSATAASEAAAERLKLARLLQRPSLSPYVDGRYSATPDQRRSPEQGSVELGVELTWNLLGEHGTYTLSEARLSYQSSQQALERTRLAAGAQLDGAQAAVKAQADQLAIQKRRLANTRQLLATLEHQMAARIIDSLSYVNAQLTGLDAETGLIDAWSVLKKSAYQLQTLGAEAGTLP